MDLRGMDDDRERFLSVLLNASNSPILITDARAPDNPIIFINPAFEQATGYRAEEVIGRNCRFLQNQDRQQLGRAAIAEAVRRGSSCEVLLRNYRKDGQMFWVRIYMFPVTDGNSEIAYFVGIQHDVTAETALVRSLQENQVFIDTSPDVYLKVAADLTILQANGARDAIAGWRPDELVGKNVAMLGQSEHIGEAQDRFRALLSAGQPKSLEAEYLSRSGRRFVIEWSVLRADKGDGILLLGRDVTLTQEAQREATSAKVKVGSILSSITEGCFSLDREWRCTYMNAKAGYWLNRNPDELIGKNLWDEFPQAIGSVFYQTYHQAMQTQQYGQCEAFYPPIGRWLEARAYPSTEGLTIFFIDISERKEYEMALVYSATHDGLTGLPNRKACLDALTRQLDKGCATGDNVAAVFIDLDRFKEINDAFGHAAGDEVLQHIGRRLLQLSSETCFAARISGDEFVFVLYGDDERRVRNRALQILDSIAEPILIKGRDVTIGASIGIAFARGAEMTADELINQADTAMYLSKANGRHAFTVFNADVNKWSLRRHRLRQDMLQGLRDGEFVLHYQPQVCLLDSRVTGAEALIRWQHPEFGLLGPAAFLELAEDSPLIIELGAWVFNEACRQLGRWQDLGYVLEMSINVSARQLANRELPDMVAQAIEHHCIAAHCVKLEITESMLAQDVDATSLVLRGLKQKGFGIALDDFGTGYSNLSYIGRLPVTTVKIDRSFVTGLATEKSALPLIRGIVALAKSLDLTVICEGIETTEQRAMVEAAQCDSIQGYLISQPLPAADFLSSFLRPPSESISLPLS